jgi:hypothetical protein
MPPAQCRASCSPSAPTAPVAGRAHRASTATSAKKAGKVDGFNASATPIPNTLLALGANGKFPAAALPSISAGRVVFRRGLSEFVDAGAYAAALATCATGETVVGGGAGFVRASDGRLDPRPFLSVNAPVSDATGSVLDDGVPSARWQAAGRNLSGESARLVVYVGCAPSG